MTSRGTSYLPSPIASAPDDVLAVAAVHKAGNSLLRWTARSFHDAAMITRSVVPTGELRRVRGRRIEQWAAEQPTFSPGDSCTTRGSRAARYARTFVRIGGPEWGDSASVSTEDR